MADKRQIVTLLTDFGTSDHFVSSVKGAMFSVNPNIEIIDITHSIPPQDIFAGAFMLRNAYNVFPRFSIHLSVVDPGVGSSRRPIIVMTDNYNFVGPDNGIFSYIYQTEQVNRVIHINSEHYYRIPLSATFHARDIFAPVVGWMTKGVDPTRIGDEITDYVKFNIPTPKEFGPNLIKGHVLHVDNFGNCITNISEEELTYERMEQQKVLVINNHQIRLFCTYYAECPEGEACALFGSNGLLEIAVPKGSAAHLLGANRGTEIAIHFS